MEQDESSRRGGAVEEGQEGISRSERAEEEEQQGSSRMGGSVEEDQEQ